MRRSKWLGILAAAIFAFAGKPVVAADTLTILWAEWDPANYRQRLGLPQGLVRGLQGEGRVQEEVRLRPGHTQGLHAATRHRGVLPSTQRKALWRCAVHGQHVRRAGDGCRTDHLQLRWGPGRLLHV